MFILCGMHRINDLHMREMQRPNAAASSGQQHTNIPPARRSQAVNLVVAQMILAGPVQHRLLPPKAYSYDRV